MNYFSKLMAIAGLATAALTANAATFVGNRDDFRDETIYFAMTTRFYDGDPTNNVLSWDKQDVQKSKNDPDWRGDFAGLIEKLDYIKALGFTAIWITPITQNASGEDYHGYHSMDFGSVDLRYESRKEWGASKDVKFQDLINAAHEKGMKVILDIVLNHTSNFGEVTLNPLFTRNQNIKNQATPAGSLIPNPDRLSANYFDQSGNAQYQERFKFFKNPQYDTHNYYHHYGTGWNWDLPNRWWGQIAGDCVDLNTENDAVAEHLVKCYGEFIKMGVDGFRIDTSGHISRLTFNTQFIPQFNKLAEEYKSKRNGGAFFMFGEVCARFGGVIYRDQHNLSSHFYTWKSDQSLINKFKSHSSAEWWDTQKLNEGHDSPVGPMVDCESETSFNKNSNNVFMTSGAWHQPDYSEYSGFSVIDFPMHYNFNDAGSAVNIAKQGDKYYNDASYNVVYVDSHDYCPGPNDGTRFNGGTAQWAENLSLMFTFRGIPCIYYGSEVEFMKGKPIDVGGENNKTPRSESGRAYFGTYLEGTVSASDFGVYSASGNVQKTLNADLAQHIIRLNKIRAAVPALRKGQYTWDGCSANGGWAFKRAYNKDGVDSYALVAINGGATFSNLPAGTYTDLVTGQSYTASQGGSITVSAPSTKGQLRVLVKGWTGGKVGEDGKFIYASSAVAKGGNVSFTDPGTTRYYTADDVIGSPSVKFNPAGGSFRTETLNVTVSLNDAATSGSYTIEGKSKVNLTPGQSTTFTIGSDMAYGQTKKVTWTASDGTETYSGTVTYKKVDPNAAITIYVTGKDNANIAGANMHAWTSKGDYFGGWPGKQLGSMESTQIDGKTFYYYVFDEESVNVIFNMNGAQTANIEGITEDTYFAYDGGTGYEKLDIQGGTPGPKAPVISANPPSGTIFTDQIQVTLSASPATDIYYTLNGAQASASSTKYTGPITLTESTTINAYAKNEVGETRKAFTYNKRETGSGITVYVTGKNNADISNCNMHAWTSNGDYFGGWPGKKFSSMESTSIDGRKYYYTTFEEETINVIFNNGNGGQTGNIEGIGSDAYFEYDGNTGYTKLSGGEGGNQGGGNTGSSDGTYHAYFDNSNSNWNPVYAYCWDDNNSEGSAFSGAWPGKVINETVEYNGKTYYHFSFTPASGYALSNPKIIFNNGNNGAGQTDDFAFVNHGIYNNGGKIGDMPSTVGIDNVDVFDGMKVYAYAGRLVIISEYDCQVQAVKLDGTVMTLNVNAGRNYYELPKGLYIVAKTKVIL